jgi:hypothetical protein
VLEAMHRSVPRNAVPPECDKRPAPRGF